MKPQALIVGAGGHARVVAGLLRFIGIDIVCILDPNFSGREEAICGTRVVGGLEALESLLPNQHDVYVAIGDNAARSALVFQLENAGYALPPVVHPEARLSYDVRIGGASCICLGVNLGTEARIGRGVIVNTGALVDHESVIADFVHLAPGVKIAGRVSVGEGAFLGMGCCVAEKLSIGRGAVIGAGSVVLKDVPDGAKVLGVFH
jgi:sugar O-acyltransferase (sialic acid O-acetyltransferase NeuD family)